MNTPLVNNIIRCKKCDLSSKVRCSFCIMMLYYTHMMKLEVPACTELLWKNY